MTPTTTRGSRLEPVRAPLPAILDRLGYDGPPAPFPAGPRGEPFRLFLRPGDPRIRMTFCVGTLRYEGSTLCEEPDIALMVARAVYVEIREAAGRLAPTDARRGTRGVLHVGGIFLTHRPKRAARLVPSKPAAAKAAAPRH